ncbi:Flp pilus assembly protein TadG [Bacillus mesophilus]|uniref:Pilus assembly protein n=1 Tax=Bacillus mesophilus TaxID=1808955 RepID=A0A6M0Q7J4_9BACI|nr:Flp pilus assembly protein TadG [Bacillus mesophilus]NEY72305.1 pilus assembly protein [Bacillus mesophilus]
MKSQKGAAMVELALCLPILVLLLFGIVDFGRIFHAYLTIDHSGREAAREASVGKDVTLAVNKAVDTSSGLLTSSDVSVTFDPDPSRGSYVKVVVSHSVNYLTPIIGGLVPPFNLIDETVMRVE